MASRVIPLGQAPLTLGRDPDNTIVIEGPNVSRRHCTFVSLPGLKHAVMDLESTNGVVVNERTVRQAVLEPFDRISLGETTLIYLAAGVDANKVLDLVSFSNANTGMSLTQDVEGLRDILLWLILTLHGLTSEEDVYPLVGNVLSDVLERTGYENALLLQAREVETRTVLEPLQWREIPLTVLGEEGLAACRPLVEEALAEGRIVTGASPLASGETLCIPMQSRPRVDLERRRAPVSRVEGALLLGAKEGESGHMSKGDRVLLQALLRQVAVIVASARLQQQATTDPLTQLCSRGCIESALAAEAHRAAVEEIPLGVVLFDIDDFKTVNDTYGHPVGDEVLREVGRRLRRELRADDTAGRWGGEEFMLLLPGNDAEATRIVAEKIVRMVSARPLGKTGVRVTVSAGVCSYPSQANTKEELVRNADVALYQAKAQGKNRAITWAPSLVPPVEDGGCDPGRTQRFKRPRSEVPDEPEPVAWLHCDLFKPVPLRVGAISLGRAQTCDICLPHPSVSRLHAEVRVDGRGTISLDDRSTNGSSLNERPVVGLAEVNLADRIQIGPFVFRVRRRQREDDKGHDTMAGEVRMGRLENISLCDLLTRLVATSAEGLLSVCCASGTGEVTLKAGQPWSARRGDRRGDDALRAMLRIHKGAFSFVPEPIEGPRNVNLSLSESLEICSSCRSDCPASALGKTCPARN